MLLHMHQLREKVRQPDRIEQCMQVQLLIKPLVRIFKQLVALFSPLVALRILEAAAARREDPHPPCLAIGVPEPRLRAQRLLQLDV